MQETETKQTHTRRTGSTKSLTGGMLGHVLRGRFISTDFFSRHWITVALLVLMFMWYITNKYECQTSMETIQKLEKELEIVRTERVREQSSYMSRIRESSMLQLVRRNHLDLEIQDTPPYKIRYNCD